MADQQHPIVFPATLLQKLVNEEGDLVAGHLATEAARWGADTELEACCEHLKRIWSPSGTIDSLRNARRPKLPSLKEQAEAALDDAVMRGDCITISDALPIIRRALEALPE